MTLHLREGLAMFGIDDVATAATMAQAATELRRYPEFVLVDMESVREDPSPLLAREIEPSGRRPSLVAIAKRADASRFITLVAAGLDACIAPPVAPARVRDVLAQVRRGDTILTQLVRAQIGRLKLTDLTDLVRQTMYEHAVTVAHGNKSAAAKLLGVDRRCVQRQVPRSAAIASADEHLRRQAATPSATD